MSRRFVLSSLLLLTALGAVSPGFAQKADTLVSDRDTIRYTYTPLQQSEAPKKNFFRRIVDYFGESTVDRTFEKKIDFTFAGGPSYSKNTNFGIGVLAAGLYRIDRTDSVTVPSDVSIFASVSVSGFYSVGISGNNIFTGNKQRISYTAMFSSAPRDFWGIKFSEPAYLEGERTQYTATGIGIVAEYDSRDFIPNPFRGIYVSFRETVYPKALGNCGQTLWRTTFTADFYLPVWKDAVLAADLYGVFNSDGTPWTLLARLGDNQRMRGYYLGQYTDNCMITFQTELRQRIWRRIGGVVWGGAGNVFPAFDRFRWDQTLPNYGIGLRWELKKRVNVRLDYGFGKKTSGFLLNINEAF